MTDVIELPIVGDSGQIPAYAQPGDAGADLRSSESLVLGPGERALVSTGIRFALPEGYAAFVVPRSGLAVKHGISIVNSPGTIDAGYRGEIKVPLINLDQHNAFEISPGDRIAQLIVMPVTRAVFVPVPELSESVRGNGGFGSTGVSDRA
ncbi:dUTP diphosphatase [Leucobacter sp. UT-8R-CII-1-4]|uniref:dUTP diphosphatase n=1 Tax=Leucobacter sp. UT-8R-CII-1-4 TaxID=3040075 RepID=UPI0024A98832|nr:dUTP diphosphatase [Leucobacter sp. UT-8R-CII-1-4]MDI6024310.1 dUTP diphosphatase [Leucobacter sp. UT-8R-CII-1-4]